MPGDTNTGSACDDCDTLVNLPFSFSLYDQTFNAVQVSSNGRADFVTINEPGGFLSECLPAPPNVGPYDYTIFPVWSDYRTDIVGEGCANFATGCGIFTSVSGVAPNRIFNIEWRTVYFADHNATANFELRVYENDPDKRFDVVIGDVQAGSDELYVSGVQGPSGLFTEDFCDDPPGRLPRMSPAVTPAPARDRHRHRRRHARRSRLKAASTAAIPPRPTGCSGTVFSAPVTRPRHAPDRLATDNSIITISNGDQYHRLDSMRECGRQHQLCRH